MVGIIKQWKKNGLAYEVNSKQSNIIDIFSILNLIIIYIYNRYIL